MNILAHFFGRRALKAVVGGIMAGGGVIATSAAQACDVESALAQIFSAGGAALAGYLATYIVPNKG